MYYSEQLNFWKQQNNDVRGMMCNPEAFDFEALERVEIISYLPDLIGNVSGL